MSEKIYARCTTCEAEFTEAQIENAVACPACGSNGKPCSPEEDVTVAINWHELRILGCWSEFWAQHHSEKDPSMLSTLATIIRRLEKQHPTKAPLTLSGEIREIPGAELYDGKGNLLVKTAKVES
jgi:predicted  nucleic acid-binding Zn-ribbon protein